MERKSLKLIRVTMKNFKVFNDVHDISFRKYPKGVTLVAGRNEVDPALGSNATGKTSILDALCWCLFGKTTRGGSLSSVIPWKGKKNDTKVSCLFEIEDGSSLEIVREYPPNRITVYVNGDQRGKSQEDIIDFIGMDFHLFTLISLFPQFSTPFFNLPNAERIDVFTKMACAHHWVALSDMARSKFKKVQEEINSVSCDIGGLSKQITQLEHIIASNKKRLEDFEENRNEKLKDISKELEKLSSVISDRVSKLDKLNSSIRKHEDEIEKLNAKKKSIEDKRKKPKNVKSSIIKRIGGLENHLKITNESLERITELRGECPYCLSVVTEEHVRRTYNTLVEKIKFIESELETEKKALVETDRILEEYSDMIVDINQKILEVHRKIKKLSGEKYSIDLELATFRSKRNSLVDEKTKLEDGKNPYKEIVDESTKSLNKLLMKDKNLKNEYNRLVKERSNSQFWVSEFKKIRVFVVEGFVEIFEMKVNSVLTCLGMNDLDFRVSLEKGANNDLSGIYAHVYRNGTRTSLKECSGGELQRISLAINLAISEMFGDASKLGLGILLLDEPSHHLSENGMEHLVKYLSQRAEDRSERVFLVDHHTLDSGLFSGMLTVVRAANGSRIEESL